MKTANRNFESEFEFKSSRSGGKGGQNVNKVETKIELNFDVVNSQILNDDEKKRIILKLQNRIDKTGILQIIAQTERSQFMNKVKAQKRFYELIENALKKEKIRKKTKPSVSSKEKRIETKKLISGKKVMRKLSDKDFSD
ncbi:MAG TPA: alternative ribosome rescue aminoacyl-tRNA hydrolase ArfB [Ignavibacteria bacterium]|nr:alternative ribosome rescue aminoacyl-tRNA hydrolase ArfB [Ignavibacteria bacterium]